MRLGSDFLSYCTNVRGFTPATVSTYAAAIVDFEVTTGIDDPEKVTIADLDAYLTRKALDGAAQSTRRNRGHVLRAFFRYLKSRGLISTNPAEEFRPPDEVRGSISVFTSAEIQRLIFMSQPPVTPRRRGENIGFFEARVKRARLCFLRDSAIIGLSYVLALRSGEIRTLRVADLFYDPKGNCYIALRGKGAKEPKNYFIDPGVARLLDDYLLALRQVGIQHPALFCPLGGGAKRSKVETGIAQTAVGKALTKRVREAGIAPGQRHLTPHVLRYSRATHLHEAGTAIEEIRDFLRHRSIETTAGYIRLGSMKAIQKRAAARLPWNRVKGVS
jgi:integrase/recombinase XerD